MEEIVDYWKKEVGRLQNLLEAEKRDNSQLRSVVTTLGQGIGAGLGMLFAVEAESGNEEYVPSEAVEKTLQFMKGCVEQADKILFPVADDE